MSSRDESQTQHSTVKLAVKVDRQDCLFACDRQNFAAPAAQTVCALQIRLAMAKDRSQVAAIIAEDRRSRLPAVATSFAQQK
ncbi:Uncharacterised protein [Vibrio cholerae]|nr:Uncharacterised protein [Vibrio cholerae]CSC67165.1 Uncharacterised protein [Vibrio cholerae]